MSRDVGPAGRGDRALARRRRGGARYRALANGLPSLRTGVALLRAAYLTRGIAAAVDEARLALDEAGASPWRGQTLGMLGQALYLAGRPDEARSVLEDARALPGAAARAPAAALVLAYLSLIALDDGERSAAERMARRALDLLEERHLAAGVVAANPHMALGSALAAGPDLHTGVEHLRKAVELSAPAGPSYWHAHALIRLASALHRVGDGEASSAALAVARGDLEVLPDAGALGALATAARAALAGRSRREGFFGEQLSEAELRIARVLASGASLSEVARQLYLSPNTVKTHRRSIYRKLGVSTRAELLTWAGTVDADGTRVCPG